MAKKNFATENPALALLGVDPSELSAEKREPEKKDNLNAGKKNIKESAESKKEKKAASAKYGSAPKGFVLAPEPKSKRLNLLMQPSLYEQVQQEAKRQKISVNEFFHVALREYFDK